MVSRYFQESPFYLEPFTYKYDELDDRREQFFQQW
jgi:hypothetical protein